MAEWFKKGSESVGWNILGNLIPIWFVFGTTIYEFGFDKAKIYEAIHQPYTFLILSASYLTTTFYIVNRRGEYKGNKFFSFAFIILLMIIGYTIKDRESLADLSASYNKELFVVIVFVVSFLIYIFFDYKSFYDVENTKTQKKREKEVEDLGDEMDEIK